MTNPVYAANVCVAQIYQWCSTLTTGKNVVVNHTHRTEENGLGESLAACISACTNDGVVS